MFVFVSADRRPTLRLLWAAVGVPWAAMLWLAISRAPGSGASFTKPTRGMRIVGSDGRPIESVAAAARETSSAARRSFLR